MPKQFLYTYKEENAEGKEVGGGWEESEARSDRSRNFLYLSKSKIVCIIYKWKGYGTENKGGKGNRKTVYKIYGLKVDILCVGER